MPWTYNSKTGILTNPQGTTIAIGYSGYDKAKNRPELQSLAAEGPIPRGLYTMGPADHHPQLGPITIPLHPCTFTNTWGRSHFFIHGDNPEHIGESSHGCPIFGPATRTMLALSTDRAFLVV